MEMSNKIALGALGISIISMIITGTAFIVGGTHDISNVKKMLGAPGTSDGLYAIVTKVQQTAESAKLTAEHAKTISEESRNLSNSSSGKSTEAKADASIVKSQFKRLKDEFSKTENNSTEALKVAEKALSLSKFDLPLGAIISWNPTYRDVNGVIQLRTLPDGWAVCNGVNGTPNLAEKFLMGVAETTQSNKLGGSNTISSAGNHTHTYAIVKGGGIRTPAGFQSEGPQCATANHNTGGAGNHSHGDNRPAYYTVVYIMKIK